jgi:hypothetical protein
MISDPDREPVFATLQAPEMQRRVVRVVQPKTIILDREQLNISRQGV